MSEQTTAPAQSEIVDRTRAYVRENFLYMRPDWKLGDEDPLLGTGVIDSNAPGECPRVGGGNGSRTAAQHQDAGVAERERRARCGSGGPCEQTCGDEECEAAHRPSVVDGSHMLSLTWVNPSDPRAVRKARRRARGRFTCGRRAPGATSLGERGRCSGL